MLSEETEKRAFQKAMKKGKVYESRVQQKIQKVSSGNVFLNVVLGNLCEFDTIVADYPILSFIEIKAYRNNLVWGRARGAANKLRRLCLKVTEDTNVYRRYRTWVPRPHPRGTGSAQLTNLELLFEKLTLNITEGWSFRMFLIVPDISYSTVLLALKGGSKPNNDLPKNLLYGDGPCLIVIPEKRINEVFG